MVLPFSYTSGQLQMLLIRRFERIGFTSLETRRYDEKLGESLKS